MADTADTADEIHGVRATDSLGDTVLHPTRDQYVDLVHKLHDDGYLMCVDLTGVDYLTHPRRQELPADVEPERFEVVVNLLNHRERTRLRIRVQVPETDPELPSLFERHPGTEAMERETYDLFGVEFTGHPDLTRILLPEEWQGHPLRKDAAAGRIPVQFKAAPTAR